MENRLQLSSACLDPAVCLAAEIPLPNRKSRPRLAGRSVTVTRPATNILSWLGNREAARGFLSHYAFFADGARCDNGSAAAAGSDPHVRPIQNLVANNGFYRSTTYHL
ncbi:hypothetical protein EYF80_052645 [Liparis tanakae]|uniref:Uncharacterized protein n=1 Tax=Liparis tanakae TaxID=230148 RepID=A0A4Z2F861_9TELE|nr:hypothetical protein EYF80_052645 [Liparis tanakae]